MTDTSLYSITQVISQLYMSVPTVRHLKVCTLKSFNKSLIHKVQGKRSYFCV